MRDDEVDEPVSLQEHDPRWPIMAQELLDRLRQGPISDPEVAVEHIGSTAVPGLLAKPVLDLMVGAPSVRRCADLVASLVGDGWTHLGEAGVPGREYLRRRDHPIAANVHVVLLGSPLWSDNLALRDHLRRDPEARDRYSAAKRTALIGAPALLDYSARKAPTVELLLAQARERD